MKVTLKIRTKLILSLSLIALIAATIGYTGFYIMQEVLKQMKITQNAVGLMQSVSHAQKHAYQYRDAMNPADHARVLSELDSAMHYAEENRKLYDWEEHIERAEAIIDEGSHFKLVFTDYSSMAGDTLMEAAQAETWQECETLLSGILKKSEGMTEGVINVIQYAVSTGMKIIILAVGLCILLIVLLTYVLTRNINRQLGGEPGEIAEIAEKIAEGNLEVALDENRKQHGVYASIKMMRDRLLQIVAQIQATSDSVLEASKLITSNSSQVSDSANSQVESVRAVSASLENMSQTIAASSTNASESVVIAGNAAKKVMKDYSETEKAFESLSNLRDQLSVIDDIAWQTNILSLNASVEAARAGENGKGFAVVAREIGKLSKQSGEASKSFAEQTELIAKSTSRKLSLIVPYIGKIEDLIKEISDSLNQQQEEANSVHESVQTLSSAANQNHLSAQEMSEKAGKLISQAESLQEAMAYFKMN